jgi:hypothetical protein
MPDVPAVGLMKIIAVLIEIESPRTNAVTLLAVGLKPSARQGEARLRGLERNDYSKSISSP